MKTEGWQTLGTGYRPRSAQSEKNEDKEREDEVKALVPSGFRHTRFSIHMFVRRWCLHTGCAESRLWKTIRKAIAFIKRSTVNQQEIMVFLRYDINNAILNFNLYMILLYLFAVERVVFLQSFSELQDFSKRSVFISLIFFYDRFMYHLNVFFLLFIMLLKCYIF